jgi:pseudouridine synthase
MKLYIHQFLSKTGLFSSKKDVYTAIRAGEVFISGKRITQPNYQFSSGKEVMWKGRPLNIIDEKIYLAVYKPEGYLSSRLTSADVKMKKKSVFSLVKGIDPMTEKTLFCVGRLDEDTSGILILTNDGKLSSDVTQPEKDVQKMYVAVMDAPLSSGDIDKIQKGVVITLEDGKHIPYKTRPSKITADNKRVTIVLTEGKKREVRRIFSAVGRNVLSLERIAIGKLTLSSIRLKKGECVAVSKEFLFKMIFS